MNFLAHAYLSGTDEQILVGNFVADSVKGSAMSALPLKIQTGVRLHRFIDHFTDNHQIVSESRKIMRTRFGKYSTVVSDVFYDYFLASQWEKFSENKLDLFSQQTYRALEKYLSVLPDKTQQFIPYLIRQDWLGSYATREGIAEVLARMSRRARFESGMEHALEDLNENHSIYEIHFHEFFPQLHNATITELENLLSIHHGNH